MHTICDPSFTQNQKSIIECKTKHQNSDSVFSNTWIPTSFNFFFLYPSLNFLGYLWKTVLLS